VSAITEPPRHAAQRVLPASAFCPVVDHNSLDCLGQDEAFLLQASRAAMRTSLAVVVDAL
jgi:hypothetical protein